MARMPLIVGYGGINAAGRSSADHGFRRTIIDVLDDTSARDTWQSLAALTNKRGELTPELIAELKRHTLVRELEPATFDRHAVPWNREFSFKATGQPVQFEISAHQLPTVIPPGWEVQALERGKVLVRIAEAGRFLVKDSRVSEVGAAGQLPSGFDPKALYPARSHPRGLQLTVFAASDALGNMGLAWQDVVARLAPDQVAVYAGSAMSQMDEFGNGGLVGARSNGRRVSSKNVALGLAEMPADFVNAYILGSVGITGHNMGACATFHYNLRAAVHEITAGRARVALVGGAEASLTPEIMDGYATMGALGSDAGLLALEGRTEGDPDYRRACRPFGENCGFTLAEASQFVILMDDELALELGAEIYGMVPDVFVNADGNKKSISSPGVGNYLTVAKALGLARNILGDEAARKRSFVHAHGTGTPQNRVSESHIFNEVAKAFGIDSWPIAAIKCYVGHSIAVAGGDQLVSCIGSWRYGWIPGITTIDKVADDVHASHLDISIQHRKFDPGAMDFALLNAKGFGGNNATAVVVSPHTTRKMLARKYGQQRVNTWQAEREVTLAASACHDAAASRGELRVIYNFDHQVRGAADVRISQDQLQLAGSLAPVSLTMASPLAAFGRDD